MTAEPLRYHADLPVDAVPLSVVEVVEYIAPDGDRRFAVRTAGVDALSTAVGLLTLSIDTLIQTWGSKDDS